MPNMTLQRVFSQRVKQVRESRGMSQSELARLVGIKPGVISQCEACRRLPTIKAICDIATALCASVDYLCGRTDMVDGIMSTLPQQASNIGQMSQSVVDALAKLEQRLMAAILQPGPPRPRALIIDDVGEVADDEKVAGVAGQPGRYLGPGCSGKPRYCNCLVHKQWRQQQELSQP
jgi:transcriptional regulator with XRE-family HTH domain